MDAKLRKAVRCLGVSQLVCWGVTYYLVGIFGGSIGADLGWSETRVQGGFSVALLVMGCASPLVGRCIDRFGGRPVLATGSVLAGLGCAGVATTSSVGWYCLSWIVLGAAMRCTLYDAAFATLARLGGGHAKRPMSQITLLGGLASTVFWPIGHGLAEALGWRGAMLVYAGFALSTLPMHLAIPRHVPLPVETRSPAAAPVAAARDDRVAAVLYAAIMTGVGFLASGLSAHLIGILTGLGLAVGTAVWVSTLRGIAQSAARLGDVLFGRSLAAPDLNLISLALLLFSFLVGFGGGRVLVLAAACAALYGAGNGLATITRGTLPLALFPVHGYGARVGRLLLPSFLLSAAGPLVYAVVLENYGATGALTLSAVLSAGMVAAGFALRRRATAMAANSATVSQM
ncbi:MFS transporter [Nocardia vulneris]|uniref:Transporter n=1 Tax=Nocardia vulneris TaxID=1141657 RepID=A0ABR4ZE57_9NOCA|nr:MFS transporter [Nocardia vulneris]KIA63648.1 transporter [Nocardia vulneris]